MGMTEYERAVTIIADHPELNLFSGPKEPALLERAEERLGLNFPPIYRRFVLEFGAGGFGGTEIYGVTGPEFDSSSIPNVVWLTLHRRQVEGLPHHLVPIHDLDDGLVDCLDLNESKEGEAPVVTIDSGPDPEGTQAATQAADFGSYLLALVQEQLEGR